MSDADRRGTPPSGPRTLDPGDLAVAQLVHDVRGQLLLIGRCADALAWIIPRGRADHELAELLRGIERASQLTRTLLTPTPPRAPERRVVELNHLITRTAHTLSRLAGDRIRLRLRLAAEPLPVVAALEELERILLNLAINACEAMAGTGVLTIETARVGNGANGRSDTSGLRALLTITDTGAGMTAAVQTRMFEPFFTTKETAVGLGLTSVAFTVKQLEGTIFIESEPSRGTSVRVILPLAR